MLPAPLVLCALFALDVSLASVPTETRARVRGDPDFKGANRRKRQVCDHGVYQHNDRDCCLCGAGQFLKIHCSINVDDGKCELCEAGTYNSNPNSALSCEPCTSCSHVNANLEVREPCTPARDATCKCKENHYCSSGTEANCRICNPCKVCDGGIKVPCTDTNDTVCKDKSDGGNQSLIIALVVLAVLVISVVVGGVYWKKRRQRSQQLNIHSNGNAIETEMQLLRDVDISPHLHGIAEVLGWRDMKAVAMCTGVNKSAIENCELNHPGNAEEQTIQLLGTWVEQQGMDASERLIQILQDKKRRAKAERIAALLTSNSGNRSHASA